MAENGDKPGDASSGLILPRFVSLCLVLTPLTGMALIFGVLLWMSIPTTFPSSLLPDAHGRLPAYVEEFTAARGGEHKAIAQMAKVCAGEANPPKVIDNPFIRIELDQPPEVNLAAIQTATELLGYLDAALYLSYAITVGRSQLAGQAVTQHLIMQVFEWTIVATGLFTTILISVKAFASPRSRDYLLMAVAAIVLSSFGTAVSTLNSFYTPRIEYERTERSLAGPRTLHWTLAASITREGNAACHDKGTWTEWRVRHIRDLTNGFVAIMSTTGRPSAMEDSSSTSEDGPTDTHRPPPSEPGKNSGQSATTAQH